MYSQVFVVLYNVHIVPLDGDRGPRCLVPPQILNQFLRLCHVELHMVLLTPCDKVVHSSPLLILITSADTSNYGRVIRKLKTADLYAITEVCVIQGEEEGREDSSLWSHGVADCAGLCRFPVP